MSSTLLGLVGLLLALAAQQIDATGPKTAAPAACGDGSETPSPVPSPGRPSRPLIIGHRGAPGYLPDHTLEGYALAIDSGVDFIEPDLVSTRDGVLVVRHEPNILTTTDVASHPEFAARRRTVTIDGFPETGFFVSDFTLAELQTLRAIQPMPERDQRYNGQFKIPTFDEVIALAQAKSKALGRAIGIYPETKHPTYHRQVLGLPLEEPLLEALARAGWTTADAPVIIQSFEQANLRELRNKTRVRLAQLVNGFLFNPETGASYNETRPYDWTVAGRGGASADLLTKKGLAEVATYADIIAPHKRYVVAALANKLSDGGGVAVDANGDGVVTEEDYRTDPRPQLVVDAHAAGLKVHTWTFRDESFRLAGDYGKDPAREYAQFFRLGIDGIFSDHCKTAVAARDQFAGPSGVSREHRA